MLRISVLLFILYLLTKEKQKIAFVERTVGLEKEVGAIRYTDLI